MRSSAAWLVAVVTDSLAGARWSRMALFMHLVVRR